MTVKTHDDAVATPADGEDREARNEIESFLRALQSYPERFASEPKLSFEQYFFRIAAR
jgi:hypothetical protein